MDRVLSGRLIGPYKVVSSVKDLDKVKPKAQKMYNNPIGPQKKAEPVKAKPLDLSFGIGVDAFSGNNQRIIRGPRFDFTKRDMNPELEDNLATRFRRQQRQF